MTSPVDVFNHSFWKLYIKTINDLDPGLNLPEFYHNLYSTLYDQPNLSNEDIFFPKNFTEGLDEQSKNECEGLLTDVECLESLKTMASNKSPGTDRLPAEFYKFFWDYVKPFLLNALNCSYTNGHLSITQRRGLITLVPKKNKPANLLKNWRPGFLTVTTKSQPNQSQIALKRFCRRSSITTKRVS